MVRTPSENTSTKLFEKLVCTSLFIILCFSVLLTRHVPFTGELLVKEWGTELLADPSFFGTMVVVRVPDGLLPAKGGPELTVVDGRPVYNYSHGAFLGNILHHKYRVEVLSYIDTPMIASSPGPTF